MIYLMTDQRFLKIGYTQDVKARLKQLKTGNPSIELVKTKPGSKLDEKAIQAICKQWNIDREWYQNIPEIINIFDEYDPFSKKELEVLKKLYKDAINNVKEGKWFGAVKSSIFQHISDKMKDATNVPEEYRKYYNYCVNIDDYSQALCCLSYKNVKEISNIKLEYKISDSIILTPIQDYFKNKTEKYEEGVKELESKNELLKALHEDLSNVKSQIAIEFLTKIYDNVSNEYKKLYKSLHTNIDFNEQLLKHMESMLMKEKKEKIHE